MGLWVLLAQSHDRTVVDGPRCGAAKRQAATDVVPALTVPAEFPKGTRAFYIMKYEISQGQYADFLNGISHYAASFRAPFAGIGYYDERGTIRIEGSAYVASKPNRPANQMSWDDGTTFADWAGLRPMTELEFTKAARGPVDRVGTDYPWGTSSKAGLLRRVGADDDLAQTGAADESRLTDDTREALGASYWWVMDLAGSVWERAVTIGHPRGRAFRGTHGDGNIRDYGMPTNDDWPQGDDEAGATGIAAADTTSEHVSSHVRRRRRLNSILIVGRVAELRLVGRWTERCGVRVSRGAHGRHGS
jgi:formylglycine-generating enzyme required for sulfatase activity